MHKRQEQAPFALHDVRGIGGVIEPLINTHGLDSTGVGGSVPIASLAKAIALDASEFSERDGTLPHQSEPSVVS